MTSTILKYAAKAKAILGIFIFMFAYQDYKVPTSPGQRSFHAGGSSP